jgi:hypothetical protein
VLGGRNVPSVAAFDSQIPDDLGKSVTLASLGRALFGPLSIPYAGPCRTTLASSAQRTARPDPRGWPSECARARGMSPHHPRCSDTTASPCRAPSAGKATYAVENVAPPGTASIHALSSMSLLMMGSSDTLRAPCRPGRPGGATLPSMHVTLHTCVRRRIRVGMSPFTSSSSDRQGLARCASGGSRATCSRGHVAPHACEARHRSGCSVAGPLEQGDIHRLACRARRVGRATCRGYVGDEHERVCRSWLARHGTS